jgi:hypothetical protein
MPPAMPFPIHKFTASFDGKLRLEFTAEGARCAAVVEPTHVVLLPDGTMAIAIRQHRDGLAPPVARWSAEGELDVAHRLTPANRRRGS